MNYKYDTCIRAFKQKGFMQIRGGKHWKFVFMDRTMTVKLGPRFIFPNLHSKAEVGDHHLGQVASSLQCEKSFLGGVIECPKGYDDLYAHFQEYGMLKHP